MKVNEIIIEDDSAPDRKYPNPLPIVNADVEFDISDEIDGDIIDDYKRENKKARLDSSDEIGKILIAGRKQYGDVQQVPIDKIVAIEPYLSSDHLKSLINNTAKSSSEYPLLLKYKGRYVAADGNHRIVAALLNNEKKIESFVIDLDKFENER